jgi:hypothetical protein
MPEKVSPEPARCVWSLIIGEYPSLTAASAAVAKQVGLGDETVRR